MKSKSYFFEIWAGVGLIFFLIAWNLPWRFQVNDDLIMMWLVSGSYTGEPESYAVFIHPMLSWMFSKAYTFAPDIPWYPLTWFCILSLSYFLILKMIAELKSISTWKHLLSVIVLMIAIHFCFFLQFTIVAGFSSLASLLILGSSKNTFSKPVKIFAWILLVFSLMIRWESMVLIGLGFLLYNLLFTSKLEFRSVFKLFFLLFIVVGLTISAKFYWERNSEYSDFLIFNKARASVIDHPVFYEQIKSDQLEEGTPWFFFARWMFEDEKIGVADLEIKKQELDAELYSPDQVINSLERLITIQKMEAFKSFISILLVLLSLIYSANKGKMVAFTGVWLLFLLVFNHFFIVNGRVTILFFLVFLFPLINSSNFPNYKLSMVAGPLLVLFGLFTFHVFNFLEEAKGRKIMHEEFENLCNRIPERELIILEGYLEHNFYFDYSGSKEVPILSLGWISRSPFQQKALEKFGISGLGEAENYSLFGIRNQEESLYFPDYMNSIAGPFYLRERIETPNFVLARYSKK